MIEWQQCPTLEDKTKKKRDLPRGLSASEKGLGLLAAQPEDSTHAFLVFCALELFNFKSAIWVLNQK